MNTHSSRSPIDRGLSADETALMRWLLSHGDGDNTAFLSQLDRARVVAHCSCGCASFDVAVDGEQSPEPGLDVLADFMWKTPEGHLCGAFVFAHGGKLGGLDLWSIDGETIPSSLPAIEALVPYGTLANQ